MQSEQCQCTGPTASTTFCVAGAPKCRPNMVSLAPDGWWHGAPFHSSCDMLCHQRSIDAQELVRVRRDRRPPVLDAIA